MSRPMGCALMLMGIGVALLSHAYMVQRIGGVLLGAGFVVAVRWR